MPSPTALPAKGSQVFRTTYAPISRHRLALYCGGSGDQNPIHVDSDFAKASGYEDVFVHGMLVMAYLGRAIMAAFPPQTVRSYAVRFVAKTQVHAAITCEGTVDAVESGYIRLKLLAMDELGDIKLTGAATLAREALLLP